MVFQFQFQFRRWRSALVLSTALLSLDALMMPSLSQANEFQAVQQLYSKGQYFLAARSAFAQLENGPRSQATAYSWITLSLVKARLYNAASYFFVRTLQSGKPAAIRRVLPEAETLIFYLGGDLFRRYLVKIARDEQWSDSSTNAVSYLFGKENLLRGKYGQAIAHLSRVQKRTSLRPYALQLRATAYAILGKTGKAIRDFEACADTATDVDAGVGSRGESIDESWKKKAERSAQDLEARCMAGLARTYYQKKKFDDADFYYGLVAKASFVWTDILFEQAWNAYSLGEYNRSLGKLVSYKNPSLSFVFNSEADVLRAQSYLALCQYSDVNQVINEFNRSFSDVAKKTKKLIQSKRPIENFYEIGKKTFKAKLHSRNRFDALLNRFVRSPYFGNLVANERLIDREAKAIAFFDSRNKGASRVQTSKQGFPGFLRLVLSWRKKTIRILGGAFVKNSMIDYYGVLVNDFEKISLIKLDMIKNAKDQLLNRPVSSTRRTRGNQEPRRRDDQYYWTFNGEFWSDEIGDYVFALRSEC